MRYFLLAALLLSGSVLGDTTVGQLEPTTGTWRAYGGTGYATLICSARSEDAVKACAAAHAERTRATTRYQLRYPNRYVTVTYRAVQPGTATLRWTAPTTNNDGSVLTDLAGYRIVYGRTATELTQVVQVPPGLSAYQMTGLAAGEWFFAVKSYASDGDESPLSGVVTKTIL